MALMLALGFLVLSPPSTRAAEAPTIRPIDCALPTVFVAQGAPTQLFAESYGVAGASLSALGGTYHGVYNAISYNQADGFLYGVSAVDRVPALVRVGADGATQDLGAVAGLPDDERFWNNGAFLKGALYVATSRTAELFKVDIATMTATRLALDRPWKPADLTAIGNHLWGVDGNRVYRVNPATGAVADFAFDGISRDDGAAGAAFTFGNGNLGIGSSINGSVSQIAIGADGSDTPTFRLVSQVPGPVPVYSNDGAACLPDPAGTDLDIGTTGPERIAQNGTLSWTITVTNHGPAASSGYTVREELPAEVADVTASGAACRIAHELLTCVGGVLRPGASATITVTGTAVAAEGTCFGNQASVSANEDDPVGGNDRSGRITTCVAAASSLDVVQTVLSPASVSAIGEVIRYSIVVTNAGAETAMNVSVLDIPTAPADGSRLSSPVCADAEGTLVSSPLLALAPGSAIRCSLTYWVSQQDLDRGGFVENAATAIGDDPRGQAITKVVVSTTRVPIAKAGA